MLIAQSLFSPWARAQAPIAAPLNISWDPWTNFTDFSDVGFFTGACGGSKCYFPVHGHPRIERGAQGQAMGWLIQPQGHHSKPGNLSVWMKTWELAEDLHTRYGANHLLLGPPRRIAIGKSDAALLNAHLWLFVWHKNISETRYAEGNVLVQPVRSCPPSSCLLMGCGHGGKAHAFARDLAAFLEHVHDKDKFIRALEQNVRSVNAMVRVTTCLHRDFQAFVRKDGEIFHIDLDRCLLDEPMASAWKDDCLDNAVAAINTEISKGENRSD